MKKAVFKSLLFVLLITSCSQEYSYVEVVLEKGILSGVETKEKDPEIISATNDTIAYLEAYKKFCISVKVNKDMEERYGNTFTTPLEFKLLDKDGNNIVESVSFITKEDKEAEIEKKIFSLPSSIQAVNENNNKENLDELSTFSKIDSVKVKELEKYFIKKTDEFSNNNEIWYEPKSAPKYTNMNGIYCYFQTQNGMPCNLRFRIQYYSDDWLFFNRIQFSIDEKAYEYIPQNVETDNGDGNIWEWFDEGLNSSDKDLIYALANAKKAKMKFIGRQYHDIKTITKEQSLAIKRTVELYKALGGNY